MRSNTNGIPYSGSISLPGAVMGQLSSSAKLSPVALVETAGRKRPIPQGPFCASTYVSIRSTCPDSCAFKDNGCYAQVGTSRRIMNKLDEGADGLVAENEAALMSGAFGRGRVPQDGARGGRDLRLHVGGDVTGGGHAQWLAGAAQQWHKRGGGAVWTYTHRWREIPASAWGRIRAWASCETRGDLIAAHRRGYRAALVVSEHRGARAYGFYGVRIIPCPHETRGVTCVKCRLCLDAKLPPTTVIGFSAHGQRKDDAKRKLRVLNA